MLVHQRVTTDPIIKQILDPKFDPTVRSWDSLQTPSGTPLMSMEIPGSDSMEVRKRTVPYFGPYFVGIFPEI